MQKLDLNLFSLFNSITIHIKVRGELGVKFYFIIPSLKFEGKNNFFIIGYLSFFLVLF
jgi:hypothetical protein